MKKNISESKKNNFKVGRIKVSDNKINVQYNKINESEDIIKFKPKKLNKKHYIKEYKKDFKKDKTEIDVKPDNKPKNAIEYYNKKYLEKVLFDNNDIYEDLINNQKVIFDKNISILKQNYNNNVKLYNDIYLDDINDGDDIRSSTIMDIYNKLLKQYYNYIYENLPEYIYNNIENKIYPEQLYILNLLIKPYSYGIYNNMGFYKNSDLSNNINNPEKIMNDLYNMTFQQSINFYQKYDDLYYLIYLSGYDLSYDEINLLISYSNFDIVNYDLNKYQLMDILLGCIKHIYNKKYILVLASTIYDHNTRYNKLINSIKK